jgi:LAS superfamily LD-carboxypeptidase LdcB
MSRAPQLAAAGLRGGGGARNIHDMSDLTSWTPEALTGRSRAHIVELEAPRCALHRDVVVPFQRMRAAAAGDEIDLVVVSSFRDFDRQLLIWNAKLRGERELLDRDSRPLDALALSEEQRVEAILYWSALPGASRHHWGTEIDVVDGRLLATGEKVPLHVAEYGPGGRYERLNEWLEEHSEGFGFFRPYASDRGGVQPEPWHLSYAPVSEQALAAFKLDMLREALAGAQIDAPETVARRLSGIWERYVVNVDRPPAGRGVTFQTTMPS